MNAFNNESATPESIIMASQFSHGVSKKPHKEITRPENSARLVEEPGSFDTVFSYFNG
jgi:hypothetical protein